MAGMQVETKSRSLFHMIAGAKMTTGNRYRVFRTGKSRLTLNVHFIVGSDRHFHRTIGALLHALAETKDGQGGKGDNIVMCLTRQPMSSFNTLCRL